MPRALIHLAEPDNVIRSAFSEHLSAGGYRVQSSSTLPVPDLTFDLILADSSLLPDDFATWMNEIRIPVILVVPPRTPADRTSAWLDAGISDCLPAPVNGVTLLAAVHRALRGADVEDRLRRLRTEVATLSGAEIPMVGSSSNLARVRGSIAEVAQHPTPVLLTGETGSGKEVVARTIHSLSGRSGEFVAINCAALGEQLFEAELFGYEPGAFTGARHRKQGLVEAADGGTLFLDEIGDMPLAVQSHLLRFLDNGRFRRVGGLRELEVDVRVIAATHRDLVHARVSGAPNAADETPSFRRDLYYRLAAWTITIAPLRDRTEDIPDLVDHFVLAFTRRTGANRRAGAEPPLVPPAAMNLLKNYRWPGNVRELRNIVERLLITADGSPIEASTVAAILPTLSEVAAPESDSAGIAPDKNLGYRERLDRHVEAFERDYFVTLLDRHHQNVTSAAIEAGLDRKTLTLKLKSLKIGRFNEE